MRWSLIWALIATLVARSLHFLNELCSVVLRCRACIAWADTSMRCIGKVQFGMCGTICMIDWPHVCRHAMRSAPASVVCKAWGARMSPSLAIRSFQQVRIGSFVPFELRFRTALAFVNPANSLQRNGNFFHVLWFAWHFDR